MKTMKLSILYNMVKGMVSTLPFYFFTFLPLNTDAQTFTQRIQTSANGEGTVTIHHDATIDALVNGNSNVSTEHTTPVKPTKPTTPAKPTKPTTPTKPIQATTTPEKPNNSQQQVAENHADNGNEAPATSVKRYRTTGYRVQVFRGGNSKADRQKAESAGNRIRDAYPQHEVYVEFFSPEWTCRVGNFRDIEEARQMRDEVRKMGFETATIVRGKIIVSIPQ